MLKEKKNDDGTFEGIDNIPLRTNIAKGDDVLPDPELYAYYDDLSHRVLYLDFEIERESLSLLQKMIIAWNREDNKNNIPVNQRKPIKILIYSYGGDLDATFGFIDLCLLSKTPIYTYNMCSAMSGGFYILLAGHKRFALKNSQILCHQGSGGFEGDAETIKSHTAQYNKRLAILADFIIERSKITKDLYNKKKKSEWFINCEEQVELGIVDKLITDIDEIID